jgi:ankyrin repeat protein
MKCHAALSGLIALAVCISCNSQPKSTKAKDIRGAELVLAAGRGDGVNVEKLLKLGAAVNHRDPVTKLTPLIQAARFGRTNTLVILLQAGADPNLQDRMGFTALTHAILGNDKNAPLVQILLDAGADPMIRDDHAFTAFDYAKASPPRTEILKLLENAKQRKQGSNLLR